MGVKAIFLDRDGVINDGTLYYTYRKEDFKFNRGIFTGLRMLRDAGFIFIVITNQAGVAKGIYTEKDVENLHAYMCDELKKRGIEIAAVYYCPHYPEISDPSHQPFPRKAALSPQKVFHSHILYHRKMHNIPY